MLTNAQIINSANYLHLPMEQLHGACQQFLRKRQGKMLNNYWENNKTTLFEKKKMFFAQFEQLNLIKKYQIFVMFLVEHK